LSQIDMFICLAHYPVKIMLTDRMQWPVDIFSVLDLPGWLKSRYLSTFPYLKSILSFLPVHVSYGTEVYSCRTAVTGCSYFCSCI